MTSNSNRLLHRLLGDISTDLRGILLPWYDSSLVLNHRAELILSRVRLLSAIFALLMPLWCLVDQFFMPVELALQLCVGRIVAALAFALMAFLFRKSVHSLHAYIALGFLFLIPTLFFIYAILLLRGTEGGGIHIILQSGYHLLPFLIAAGLSLFPLTALEGVIFAIPVVVVQWVSTIALSQGLASNQPGLLWLIVLIACVAILSGMTQLHYLSEIVTKSARDPLTSAYNRMTGEEFLEKYLSMARRTHSPFTLVYIDIDHFKSVNDNFGHEAGDALLEQVSGILASQLRREDSLIRWGGEEFILALPMANREDTASIIARLGRQGLGLRPDGTALTASVGSACNITDQLDELPALLQLADERMYLAKQGGRNRYCDGSQSEGQKMVPFIKIGA